MSTDTGNQVALRPASGGELSIGVPIEQIRRLGALARACSEIHTKRDVEPFERAFLIASGMKQIREAITDEMMQDVFALQGSPLGFKTDKDDKGGYDVKTIKEAAIEATFRGLRLVGNEINIIASRMYAAKDGLRRLVLEWPGLSEFREQIGIPRKQEGFTVVPCKATWKLNGETQTLDCTGDNSIPIRVNESMIVDAILGKCKRKLYARVYDRLTGCDCGLIEQDGTAIVGTNAALPGPNEEEIEAVVSEYKGKLDSLSDPKEVSTIIREASRDNRLHEQGRKEVARLGGLRANEIRDAKRNGRPVVKPQQQTFVDKSVEDHSQLVAEWTDAVNIATSRDALEEIMKNAAGLPSPVRGLIERMVKEKIEKLPKQ